MRRLLTWIRACLFASVFTARSEGQQSPFESRVYERGGLKISVGSPRMIMRGPMFPWGMVFDDGSILIIASSVEEGGPPACVAVDRPRGNLAAIQAASGLLHSQRSISRPHRDQCLSDAAGDSRSSGLLSSRTL